jgi:hypothetical protein
MINKDVVIREKIAQAETLRKKIRSLVVENWALREALDDLVDWMDFNQRSIEGEFCMDELLADARAALQPKENDQ